VSEELERIEDEWAAAIVDRDVEAARNILAEDFVLSSVGGDSEHMAREQWLDALPRIETRSLTCTDVQSREFDDVALVRARLRWEASLGEHDLTGDYAVADVFTRRADRWRFLADLDPAGAGMTDLARRQRRLAPRRLRRRRLAAALALVGTAECEIPPRGARGLIRRVRFGRVRGTVPRPWPKGTPRRADAARTRAFARRPSPPNRPDMAVRDVSTGQTLGPGWYGHG